MLKINGIVAGLKKQRQRIDQALEAIDLLKATPKDRPARVRRLLRVAAELERKVHLAR
jgi:hypothetical protein